MVEQRSSRQAVAVAAALEAAGATGEIRTLSDSTHTAADAAAGLGCEVGAIASSLVFRCDGEPLLVMTSGRHRVNTTALAERLGRGEIGRAMPGQVREATGQVIGSVAPVGHPAPIETVVDETLANYPVLWASAGTANSVFATDYAELLTLTHGRAVQVN